MNAVTEIEATAVHAPGTDLAPYAAHAPEEYRARFVMEPSEAAALDKQLRECMRAVLVSGTDYGTIPGMGDKPSLFKPGAEKLIQWFGFGFETVRDEIERDREGTRLGVTYKCTVYKQLADGRKVTVATCEGYAGYDEDKFYTPLEAARAKAEAAERRWASKDNRAPNPKKWETASEYRAPWNSVLKMAQKRALVGAAIDATAAAGLFTQDLEDMRGSTAPDAASLAEVATAAVMALPEEVRGGLDRWYRGKRWPASGQWTAEQWCEALQMAGYLTAKREQPPTPPQDRPAPAAAQAATATAAQDAAGPASAGQAPVAALDPENPWSVAVEGAVTAEDIAQLRSEAEGTYPDDDPRQAALLAALDARDAEIRAASTPSGESTFVRTFRARVAAASPADHRPLKIEIARAVSAKKITPDEGNSLATALRERENARSAA